MKEFNTRLDSAFDTLMSPKTPWNKDAKGRADMTIACRDGDGIPRVKNAGGSKTVNGMDVQIMHNGLLVKKNGYQGEWQARTIEQLKGIHEPQEEKVFFEILKRLEPNSTMMELGSWWSYYSMWFLRELPKSKAVCCEPDPTNLALGQANAKLNGFSEGKDISFYPYAAGSQNGKVINFTNEDGSKVKVPIRTVDNMIDELKLSKLDVLHLDIQGIELDALKGAAEAMSSGKIRFIFVSTHHYSISGDPLMHQKCVAFIRSHGGNIVASHTVLESCSGDGLIVASFAAKDKGFKVRVSLQHSDDSLFRPYEEDVDILWQLHDRLVEQVACQIKDIQEVRAELVWKSEHIDNLETTLKEIGPLKKHLKRQVQLKISNLHKKSKT